MILSFLRSWRRATYHNLITRAGVASSAPAPPSRRSATQTVWRRNACRAPPLCIPHSPGQYHQSSGSPIRRLYSHQATAEDSEPAALFFPPDGATTAFQRRRLRARYFFQAEASENSAFWARKNPHRSPKLHKVLRRNDRRLGKAARATQQVQLGEGTGAPKVRKRVNQEHNIPHTHPSSLGSSYFQQWAPLEVADIEHLQAVQAAVGAARKAEGLARWAEKATEVASAAIASSNQTFAKQVADAARTEAELAALDAEQKTQLAADKEEAAEELRAEMRARLEKRFPHWIKDRTKSGLGDKLMGLVHSPCRICYAPHSLNECPLLFPNLDRKYTKVDPRYRDLFRDKLALDKKFREGIGFIQSTFQVSSGSFGAVVPLAPNVTRDAPASATKYLQEFGALITFRNIIGGKDGPGLSNVSRSWETQPGHYITKDDDGRTFAIYWHTNAPSDRLTDPNFLPEVQKFRSFVTAWGKGKKARYGQDPFSDMPSIDIVICVGRWHRTRARSDDMHRAVLSLWVSNEELWKQGLFYKGIHIGTKDDQITSEFDWWSYGRPEMYGSPIIDLHCAPIPSSTSEFPTTVAKGLLRATLRSVVERVPAILDRDLKKADRVALENYQMYQVVAKARGVRKYGKASVQDRLINDNSRGAASRRAVGDRYPQWAPSWEVMMRLDADAQAVDARQPRPLPRTLRRQRLLRPRPSPASDSTSTDHLPWRQRYQMRSIMSPDPATGTEVVSVSASTDHPRRASGYQMRSILTPDTAPKAEAASSSDAGTHVAGSVSAPSASSQQKTPDFQIRRVQMRRYLYSADSAQNGTDSSFIADTNSTGRAEEILSTPNLNPGTAAGGSKAEETLIRRVTTLPKIRQRRSSGYRAEALLSALLSALDPGAEIPAAAGSSKPEEGREAVEHRPKTWSCRQERTNKNHKPKGRHESSVPYGEDAHSF